MSGGVARAFWNLEGPTSGALPHTDLFSSFFDHGPESGAKVDHTLYHTVQVILARPKAAAVWVEIIGTRLEGARSSTLRVRSLGSILFHKSR
jgi:hypothetical protein